MIRKFLAAGAVAFGLMAFGASAADIKGPVYKAPPAVFDWSGWYVGGTVGYGWSSSTHDNNGNLFSGAFDVNGIVAGGTLGMNIQRGNLVYGLEADLSYSDINGSTAQINCVGACITELKWFGTVRGRLGIAYDRVMPYITGGVAFGRVNASIGAPLLTSGNSTEVGWTAGAGIEFALSRRWSMKLEYLHVNVGDDLHYDNIPVCAAPGCHALYDGFNIVRVGANYRW
ncbi:MAG TPA: porin family protein [Xanthobacteraceae bacterium]|nr:porin family protein [Xanthobacteraceae bacterium]